MTVSVLVNGATYDYTDYQWEQLQAGDLDTYGEVLRHVIKQQNDKIAQFDDEWSDAMQVIENYREENAELKKEQALGWETKPARAKRKKALTEGFNDDTIEELLKNT